MIHEVNLDELLVKDKLMRYETRAFADDRSTIERRMTNGVSTIFPMFSKIFEVK